MNLPGSERATALIERAHEAFDAAYREALPLFGDAEDHAEAVRCGVEAVLVMAGAVTPEHTRIEGAT